MRNFIDDIRLLKTLAVFEEYLGYSVNAAMLSAQDARYMACSVFCRSGKWEFYAKSGARYTAATMCHELMHICLYLEGWPLSYLSAYVEHGSEIHHIVRLLLNTAQHVEVWDRVRLLGYDNDIQDNISDVQDILHDLRRGSFCSQFSPKMRSVLTATYVAQALFLPLPRQLRRELQREAQRLPRQTWETCQKIVDSCSSDGPRSGQWYAKALEKSLEAVSLPTDTLRHEFPLRVFPDTFSRIQKIWDR